jgi:hypothetical protein
VVEQKNHNQGYRHYDRGNFRRQYPHPRASHQPVAHDRDVIMVDRSRTPSLKLDSPIASPSKIPSPPHQPPLPTPPPPSQPVPDRYRMPPMPTQILLEDQVLE